MKNNSLTKKRQKQAFPIPSSTNIDLIRRSIKTQTRDLLLFDLAIETGVTASQLLRLKVKDLAGLNIGDEISTLAGKMGRNEPITIGPKTYASFQQYLLKIGPSLNDPLFKSRKANGAISLPSASRLVRSWFEKAGLDGMSGFLSLRKTWEKRIRESETKKTTFSPSEPSYAVKPFKAPTTQETVYKELEYAIVTERTKSGERLVGERLARQVGGSSIAVCEEIGRLEARNFLTVHPKKGATANEFSEEKLKELFEIRLLLELPAAKKAAIAATKADVEIIERLNQQYFLAQEKKDMNVALSKNREFHFAIYRVANMPILFSMIQNLWDQVSPYYHLMYHQELIPDPHTGRVYHNKVIEGMAANNPRIVSNWLEIELVESSNFVANFIRMVQRD